MTKNYRFSEYCLSAIVSMVRKNKRLIATTSQGDFFDYLVKTKRELAVALEHLGNRGLA